MKPEKSILDRSFVYTPSHQTDVTRTWEIYRQKLDQERKKREEIVKQLPKRTCVKP